VEGEPRSEKADEALCLDFTEVKFTIEGKKPEIEARAKPLKNIHRLTRQFKVGVNPTGGWLQRRHTVETVCPGTHRVLKET
jgi:hypothetical protein